MPAGISGGPAKVSVLSSALLGSISGSSIANTVTTGSLTIPAMIRIGYPRHFAAAVEAAASTGGQITPPVMGAAAFLMVEFLGIPYTDILLAAMVPASMHFLGVLLQVHFEAKRQGLRGLSPDELPKVWQVLKRDWPTVFPLFMLVGVLLNGNTPYLAAFWGITACVVIGFLNPRNRLTPRDVFDAFVIGAKYALAVGAAAADGRHRHRRGDADRRQLQGLLHRHVQRRDLGRRDPAADRRSRSCRWPR